MTLQDIFDQLSYGELSQISIGGSEAGIIESSNYVRVLSHVNLALTALYKRFPLKQSKLLFALQPAVYNYDFPSNDILKIEQVLTDAKEALPLNDTSDVYSVITPTHNTLTLPRDVVNQVTTLPDWLRTVNLELVYRANHPKIVVGMGVLNPSIVTVQLPDAYMEPLLLFIAARMMTPLGVGQLEGFVHTTFFSRYEAACLQLEQKNLGVDQGSQGSRLRDKGWA